jgi:hypothetical protein
MGGSTPRTNEVTLGSLEATGDDTGPEFNVNGFGQGQGSNGSQLGEENGRGVCQYISPPHRSAHSRLKELTAKLVRVSKQQGPDTALWMILIERTSSGGWGLEQEVRNPQDIYIVLHNQGEIVYLQQFCVSG